MTRTRTSITIFSYKAPAPYSYLPLQLNLFPKKKKISNKKNLAHEKKKVAWTHTENAVRGLKKAHLQPQYTCIHVPRVLVLVLLGLSGARARAR